MEQECACEICGYRPRAGDRRRVEVASGDEYVWVTHVICYDCGAEWVE
jgi:hypothetical protein